MNEKPIDRKALLESLEWCANAKTCDACSYEEGTSSKCINKLMLDALYALREAEEQNKALLLALHKMGGSGVSQGYYKGWDDAITEAIAQVEQITGVDGDQLGDKLLDEIEIEVDSL